MDTRFVDRSNTPRPVKPARRNAWRKFVLPACIGLAFCVGFVAGREHLRYQLKQKMQAVADQLGADLKAAFKARQEEQKQ